MDQKTLRSNSYFVNNYIVNFFQEKMKRGSKGIEILESLYHAHCNLGVQTLELLFLQKLKFEIYKVYDIGLQRNRD